MQKKKNKKKKNQARKALAKEFQDRCVSRDYSEIMARTFQADCCFTNYNRAPQRAHNSTKAASEETDSSSASSNEDFEDYRVDGYHPMHVQ